MAKNHHIAIVGGGINGLCTAWALAQAGCQVELFERDELLSQTSQSSSKLLHGGLRYLENFEFRLVKEALAERHWWLNNAPDHLVKPLKIVLPIHQGAARSRFMVKTGLWLYDRLAGSKNIGSHAKMSIEDMTTAIPSLSSHNLRPGYCFFDGQMDDHALGKWVAETVSELGVKLHEHHKVSTLTTCGELVVNQTKRAFDHVINLSGPWAQQLLSKSGIHSGYKLDLVRGSHIVIDRPISCGVLLPVPNEKRIFFVLPYQGRTMIGTTEERQKIDEPICPSEQEIHYLINAYNHYFDPHIKLDQVVDTFSGVRPLIYSADNPSKATREYKFETRGKLTTVFGGKWTTARALGQHVAKAVITRLD